MLLCAVTYVLASNAVSLLRDKSVLFARAAISVFVSSIIICYISIDIQFFENGIGMYGGLYQASLLSDSFQIFIFILACIILQLNAFFPRKVSFEKYSNLTSLIYTKVTYFSEFIENKKGNQFKIIEYPLIIIFIIIGATFLMSSLDLVSLFLSLELQSYGLYILCTVYRNSERSVSGGLMYFLLGGLSSCFVLLAAGLLYSNSGNTNLEGIYIINSISTNNQLYDHIGDIYYSSNYINFSLLILSVGLLFKVSAAPFHFWSPDVYDAIPTIVTTFVAIIAKVSLFIIMLELIHFTISLSDYTEFSWTNTLILSSLISLVIGSILGLTQFRIKRLFAYSTISHLGFILLALTVNTVESIQSFIFYLIQYSLSNLNAFILLITIGYSLYCYKDLKYTSPVSQELTREYNDDLVDKQNSPIQLVSQLQGYFSINAYLAISLAITLFSFVGIPPLVGFFAKQMVLSSAIDNGYIFISIVAILTSVISAYYYLVVVKQIFFYDTPYKLNPIFNTWTIDGVITNIYNNIAKERVTIDTSNIKLSSSLTITVSILTLLILFFIFIPNELLRMANILALILFNE